MFITIRTDFQAIGRLGSISYVEKDNGTTAQFRWTITVKSKKTFTGSLTITIKFRASVDGVVMGSCDAPRMALAKEAAAEQALKSLGLE
jgi:hypothetical protein